MSHTNVGFCNCAECATKRGRALIIEQSQGALIDTLIDAMEEVRALIEGYIDVDDEPDSPFSTPVAPIANDAMRADQLLEGVITKARRARQAQGGAK